jgi:beta-galactosidase/beta-glucuronidase
LYRSAYVLGLLLGFTASTYASTGSPEIALPAATQGPMRIDLSGQWDFRFDPKAEGEGAGWFAPGNKQTWEKAKVPGSFNEEFAAHPKTPDPSDTYRFYTGKAWYRTRFQSPKDLQSDFFLHFSGTVLRQKVWLNGKLIGTSNLPWLDVEYDISAALHRGAENTLVVEVDNSVLRDAVPDAKWRGWWNDGGLIWPVYLEKRPRVRSESFATTTLQPDGSWKLTVQTEVMKIVRLRPRSICSLPIPAERPSGTASAKYQIQPRTCR